MYCNKCGNKLKSSDEFCSCCGSSLKDNDVYSNLNNKNDYSLIFGIIAIVTFVIPVISIPCAVIAIIKNKKSNNGRVGLFLGIMSLVFSILLLILIALVVAFSINFLNNNSNNSFFDGVDRYFDYFGDKFDDSQDRFDKYFHDAIDEYDDDRDDNDVDGLEDRLSGNNYIVGDGSILMLKNDDSYIWYDNSNMDDKNYSSGSYDVYRGYDAVQYIAKNLSEYGMNYDSQMKFFDGDDDIDNYYLLILNCDKMIVDGKDSDKKEDKYIYYGFYDDDNFKFINIKSKENLNLRFKNKFNGRNDRV